MNVYIKIFLVLLLCAVPFINLSAQGEDIIPEAVAGNFFGVGARAMAMGGAHTAAVMDGSALLYNPAALARIRKIEILGGLSHQMLDNDADPDRLGNPISGLNSRDQNNTRLNTLTFSVPYPTYRGSLVFAFGLNRVRSFDKTFNIAYTNADETLIGTESSTGSIYALSAGAGIDISPRVSLGGALNFYFGTHDYNWRLDYQSSETEYIYDDNIEDRYTGVSAKVGIMFAASRVLRLGTSIETPIQYSIAEEYILRTFDQGGSDYDFGSYEYDLLAPFKLDFGMALNLNMLQLAADINYVDWSQIEYQDDAALERNNIFINDYYRDVLGFSVGAEYMIPKLGLMVRGGYRYDPLPYNDENTFINEGQPVATGIDIVEDRKFVTFGFGYLIDRVMTIDIAVALGGYEIMDNDTQISEEYSLKRIYVSTGFRL